MRRIIPTLRNKFLASALPDWSQYDDLHNQREIYSRRKKTRHTWIEVSTTDSFPLCFPCQAYNWYLAGVGRILGSSWEFWYIRCAVDVSNDLYVRYLHYCRKTTLGISRKYLRNNTTQGRTPRKILNALFLLIFKIRLRISSNWFDNIL